MSYAKKIIFRTFFISVIFLLTSIFIKIDFDAFFINTLYTVSGIFFSFGLGIIINFNIREVKNPKFIRELRHNRDRIRNSFIICFFLNTFCLILYKFMITNEISKIVLDFRDLKFLLNFPILFGIIMIYSIYYYILNFTSFQKLNDDIFDKIDKEKG